MKANNPTYFLAEDVAAARSMVWMLAGGGEAWEPAMVCPLADSSFEEYERQVKAGARPAGRLIWGTAFDVE